jgi:WD40 repeat protein
VWDIAVSSTGAAVASGAGDGKLVVWESGPEGWSKKFHVNDLNEGGIQSMSWSSDGIHLLTTG